MNCASRLFLHFCRVCSGEYASRKNGEITEAAREFVLRQRPNVFSHLLLGKRGWNPPRGQSLHGQGRRSQHQHLLALVSKKERLPTRFGMFMDGFGADRIRTGNHLHFIRYSFGSMVTRPQLHWRSHSTDSWRENRSRAEVRPRAAAHPPAHQTQTLQNHNPVQHGPSRR